jgi:hypothetical protein
VWAGSGIASRNRPSQLPLLGQVRRSVRVGWRARRAALVWPDRAREARDALREPQRAACCHCLGTREVARRLALPVGGQNVADGSRPCHRPASPMKSVGRERASLGATDTPLSRPTTPWSPGMQEGSHCPCVVAPDVVRGCRRRWTPAGPRPPSALMYDRQEGAGWTGLAGAGSHRRDVHPPTRPACLPAGRSRQPRAERRGVCVRGPAGPASRDTAIRLLAHASLQRQRKQSFPVRGASTATGSGTGAWRESGRTLAPSRQAVR